MKPKFSSVPMEVYKFLTERAGQVPEHWHPSAAGYLSVHLKNTIKSANNFELPPKYDVDALGDTLSQEEIVSACEKGLALPFPAITLSRTVAGEDLFIVAWDDYLLDAIRIKAGEKVEPYDRNSIYVHAFLLNTAKQWLPSTATIRIPTVGATQINKSGDFGVEYNIAWGEPNFAKKFDPQAPSQGTELISIHSAKDVIELCTYLSRPTTKTEITRQASLKTKLSSSKKLPKAFYEIHRVVLGEATVVSNSEPKGGTHASPRWHERRGYWRTMKKSGKRVWVRSCEVGKKSDGMVYKDYEVKIGEK